MRVTNNLLFDGLTRFDDDTYQPKPDLAESWTVSKDGLEYVFKLRRGVVFHDGSPFTAHDVKWSWEVICHKDNPRIADVYVDHYVQIRGCREFHEGQAAGVDGIEVVDDHTLRVRLTEPYAPFLVSTAVTGILPRAKYASIPVKALLQHPLSRAPIGTGPFSYVDWKEGDRLVLKANPRYFLGKPKLDGLIIRFMPDPAARLIEFKNGTLHFAFFSPVLTDDFNAAKADPRLVARAYAGVWNYFTAVDHTNPLFKDARVRQALTLAIDRRRVLDEQWGGYGVIANSPINPSLPAFDKKVAAPAYDPVKARGLLAEAGWRAGATASSRRTASASRSPSSISRGPRGAWPSSTRTSGRRSAWTCPSTPSTSPRSGACAFTPASSRPSASSGPRASIRTPPSASTRSSAPIAARATAAPRWTG